MDKDAPGSGLWNKVEDWRGSFLKSLKRQEDLFFNFILFLNFT